MRNFDLEKIRFFSIIAGMCLVLILIVWKAYDYLPQEMISVDNSIQEIKNNDTVTASETNNYYEEKEYEYKNVHEITQENSQDDEFEKIEVPVSYEEKKRNLKPLETIFDDSINPQIKTPEKTPLIDNTTSEMFAKAQEYIEDQAYDMAISEYKDIINITENLSTKAECYDNLAKIYERQRKFGSAITNAQKANSIEASNARKDYLNYLYEKTGYKK